MTKEAYNNLKRQPEYEYASEHDYVKASNLAQPAIKHYKPKPKAPLSDRAEAWLTNHPRLSAAIGHAADVASNTYYRKHQYNKRR